MVVVVVGLCPVFTRLCVAPPCSCLTAALLTQIGAAWTEGKLEQDRVTSKPGDLTVTRGVDTQYNSGPGQYNLQCV